MICVCGHLKEDHRFHADDPGVGLCTKCDCEYYEPFDQEGDDYDDSEWLEEFWQ